MRRCTLELPGLLVSYQISLLLFEMHIPHASTFCANHSFNLSSAFPRWDILFFSLLSISAYVWPSYSKHESQPANSLASTSHYFAPRPLTHQTQYSPGSPPTSHPSYPETTPARAPGPRSTRTCTRLARICRRSRRGACAFGMRRGIA